MFCEIINYDVCSQVAEVVIYNLQYLGCTEVFDSRGMQVCEDAVKALKAVSNIVSQDFTSIHCCVGGVMVCWSYMTSCGPCSSKLPEHLEGWMQTNL